MATVSEQPKSSPPPQRNPSGERLIDEQIRRTRRSLKLVDVTTGLISMLIGVIAYLLTMALLDHWVIPGGWSSSSRSLLFGILVVGMAIYSWRTFAPLLRNSINPAYAAQTIEESSPSLKNSLLNLLLLRGSRRSMPQQVYQAIEQQAAQRLSQVRMESVVDRSTILRLGYILVALTAVCVLYKVLSPKDLFSSASRVLLPWADIAAPSRVFISNVTPADAKAARGESIKVTAEVLGLEANEPVRLRYSTIDQSIVDQEIAMTASAGGNVFSCQLPARGGFGGVSGLQQDLKYWIEAGDATSKKYHITVFARPTMVVTRLRYEYPAYTGFASRNVEHTGDIQAVEGTKVTLFAQANKPIKNAHVDFDVDGRNDLLMKADDQQASITFGLALKEDRRTPEHNSYALRYTTLEGNRNQQPPKYQIDVQPDYAPEIQLLLPEEAVIEVALNQEINFELEAIDPDFALNQVLLVGVVGDEQKLTETLLDRRHTGRFTAKTRLTPEQIGLKAGDVLEYWGVAADNRRPEPNLAYSVHRKIRVVGPWQGNRDGQGDNSQEGQGNQSGEGNQSENGESGEQGQAGGGESGSGGEDGESSEGAAGSDKGESSEQNGENQEQGDSNSASNQNGENESSSQQGNGASDGSQNSESSQQPGDRQSDNNNEQAGDSGEQQSEQSGSVSSEGDEDAEAFERMADHFNEQDENNGSAAGNENQQGSNSGNEKSSDQSSANREDSAEQQPNENAASKQPDSESAGSDQENTNESENGSEQNTQTSQEKPDNQENGQESDADGKPSDEQGNAGAGQESGEQEGTATPEDKKPKEKQTDSSGDQTNNGETPSNSRDNAESDSEGGQSGDRSGGGQEGAGQQADSEGKGAAGQNTASDEGAGRSDEQGDGETGDQAGDQQTADGKTGNSSEDQTGNGSKKDPQPGEQSGGEQKSQGEADQNTDSGNNESSDPSEANSPNTNEQQQNKPEQSSSKKNDSSKTDGTPQSGDPQGSRGNPTSPPTDGELHAGDEANLDYAKKQTDLILDRLEDQLNKKRVDQGLLEKLGWSRDELQRFVDRWKSLKNEAERNPDSADAKNELNDALKSLGIKRNQRTTFQSKITKDRLRDLRESYRGRVPLEYQDQVNRYLKGTAASQETE